MCCALNHSSFSGLNTASLLLMPSSENAATSSSRENSSWSLPGDQPSSARKFIIASGRYPCREYSVTDVAPWRLLSRRLSGPRMRGTCAKAGNGLPNAR